MKIRVNLFGGLEEYSPENKRRDNILDLPEEAVLEDVLSELGIPSTEAKVFLVNGVHQDLDQRLVENDKVSIFPLLGGG